MPTKQKRLCNYRGCRNIATKGSKCDDHYEPPKRKESGQYHHWYNLPAWKALRMMWLKSHPLCEECKRNGIPTTPATLVDHIEPHRGDWNLFMDPENLQSLCSSCHSKKTATEDGGFGNTRGGRG